jgi:hypothetical protein
MAQEIRGFVNEKGQFLNRSAASLWVKRHQPEVYAKLSDEHKKSLHTQGYNEAMKVEEPSMVKFRKLKISEMEKRIESMSDEDKKTYQPILDAKRGK